MELFNTSSSVAISENIVAAPIQSNSKNDTKVDYNSYAPLTIGSARAAALASPRC